MGISDTVWIWWPLCCLHCKETAERHQCFNCLQLVKLGLIPKALGHCEGTRNLADRLVSLGTVSPEEKWGRKSFSQALQDFSGLSVAWLPVSHYQKPICTSQTFVTGGFLLFFSPCAPTGECSWWDVLLVPCGPGAPDSVSFLQVSHTQLSGQPASRTWARPCLQSWERRHREYCKASTWGWAGDVEPWLEGFWSTTSVRKSNTENLDFIYSCFTKMLAWKLFML